MTGRYATVLGVPPSLIGSVFFVAMFHLGIALITGRRGVVVRAYDLPAFVGVLAAVVLFLLPAVVLKAYCTYCLATEAIALSIRAGSLLVTSSADGGASEEADSGRR